MAKLSFVLAQILLMGLMTSSSAYDFYVGGRAGWIQSPKQSYNNWAGRMRFHINDKLGELEEQRIKFKLNVGGRRHASVMSSRVLGEFKGNTCPLTL
ncbi:uncharacterized protein A4U43_C05F30620 [Asparagus officinalis]|uniref:Phytocyanin domain-containing protein n=1 Tax=Asparagus officinalis TaxID=4686 RepID=A0A5P1EVN5_ASPOF|nr:uncharacterized protein A4U43_C05F30620 [Asparagus officinalis]